MSQLKCIMPKAWQTRIFELKISSTGVMVERRTCTAHVMDLTLLDHCKFLATLCLCYWEADLLPVNLWRCWILVKESQCKGSDVPSFRSLALRLWMNRGWGQWVGGFDWFGSVLSVSFSALMLLVGWQEGHLVHKTTCATYHQRFQNSWW